MRRIIVVAAACLMSLAMVAGPASAHHGTDPIVGPHKHVVTKANAAAGAVTIGPDACSDGMSLQFDHVHMKVHEGAAGTINSDGPIGGAGC